jgi:hypothetical protein
VPPTARDGSSSPTDRAPRHRRPRDQPGGALYQFTPYGLAVLFIADLEVDGREDLWIADDLVFEDDFETDDLSAWTLASP